MKCDNGHDNSEESQYCSACGALLGPPAEVHDVSEVVGEPTVPELLARQRRNDRRSLIGLLVSVFGFGVGGIVGVILGQKSLNEIRDSHGRLSGRGMAMASIVVGAFVLCGYGIGLLIGVFAVGGPTGPTASDETPVQETSAYSITFTDELYGTTCAAAEDNFTFDASYPVKVFTTGGQLLATGWYFSEQDDRIANESGHVVDVCRYLANLWDIEGGHGSYVFVDGGEPRSDGLRFTEVEVRNDQCGFVRGWSTTQALAG